MASFSLTQKGSLPKTVNPFNGKGPQTSFGASSNTTASSKPIQQATPAQSKVMSTALGNNPGMLSSQQKSSGITAPGAITSLSGYSPISQNTQKNPLDSYGSGNKDVKSVTQPDGTKIDLYSDNMQSDKKQTDPPQKEEYKINPDIYGQLTTGLANQAQNPTYSPNPAIQGLMGFGSNTDSMSPQIKDALSKISDIDQAEAATAYNLNNSGIDLGLATGQQGELAKKFGAQRAGYAGLLGGLLNQRSQNIGAVGSAGGLGVSAQGQAQGALGQAAGLAQPQLGSFGQGYYNPIQPGPNAASGQFSGVTGAANVESVKAFQTEINKIGSLLPSADAAISILSSYAQNVGGGNTPILQGLQQLYGSTAQGSQAVAGFQAQLQAVRQAWQEIAGGDATQAIPDNVTAQQLQQIQQQLKTFGQNKVTGYQNQLNQLLSGGGSSSSGSGDIWDF